MCIWGTIAFLQDNDHAAGALYDEALLHARASGDKRTIASYRSRTLRNLVTLTRGDQESAEPLAAKR